MADDTRRLFEPSTGNRLLLLLILLPLAAGLLVAAVLWEDQGRLVRTEQERYGQSLARQLADHSAQLVMEQDFISLNVLAARLTATDPVRFVGIYTDQNRLIAQSGREHGADRFFTAEISFQDSVVGYTRVGVATATSSLSIPALLLCLIGVAWALLVWRFRRAVQRWLEAAPGAAAVPGPVIPMPEPEALAPALTGLLVVRIRPSRQLDRHFDRFFEAAVLYGGIVEQTTPEELVIHFEDPDAVYLAVCCGLLIREITAVLPGRLSFGGIVDLLGEDTGESRKRASFLASVASNELLLAGGEALIRERVQLGSFHHSMVDSRDLQKVTGMADQSLLDSQARDLVAGNRAVR